MAAETNRLGQLTRPHQDRSLVEDQLTSGKVAGGNQESAKSVVPLNLGKTKKIFCSTLFLLVFKSSPSVYILYFPHNYFITVFDHYGFVHYYQNLTMSTVESIRLTMDYVM